MKEQEELRIFTPNEKRWNTERSVPELGLIKIDELGYTSLDVNQYHKAKALEEMQVDFFVVDQRKKVESLPLLQALNPPAIEEEIKVKEEDEIKKVEENTIPEQTEQSDFGNPDDAAEQQIADQQLQEVQSSEESLIEEVKEEEKEEQSIDEQEDEIKEEETPSLTSNDVREKIKDMDIKELQAYVTQFPDIFDKKKVATLNSVGKLKKYVLDTFKKLSANDLVK